MATIRAGPEHWRQRHKSPGGVHRCSDRSRRLRGELILFAANPQPMPNVVSESAGVPSPPSTGSSLRLDLVFKCGYVYPDLFRMLARPLAKRREADSAVGMIQRGFLDSQSRRDLTELGPEPG